MSTLTAEGPAVKKRYVTTIQTGFTMPGDLIPPGGPGWELFQLAERKDGGWLLVWCRDEKPCHCLACPGGMACPVRHTPYPHCSSCLATGWVAA